MGAGVHLWQIDSNDQLSEIDRSRLDLESRLQEWLAHDVSVLDPGLLVIGREVETDFGGSSTSSVWMPRATSRSWS